jgi:hypothetical protein
MSNAGMRDTPVQRLAMLGMWTVVSPVMLVTLVAPAWFEQRSGVTARLRGVSAVSDRVAWASGSGGTVLRPADGGVTWHARAFPDAETLDFRDVDAVSADVAYVLSIGSGAASRIYKTTDASAGIFSIAFRDAQHQFANGRRIGWGAGEKGRIMRLSY